jgi:hypothetical protein
MSSADLEEIAKDVRTGQGERKTAPAKTNWQPAKDDSGAKEPPSCITRKNYKHK